MGSRITFFKTRTARVRTETSSPTGFKNEVSLSEELIATGEPSLHPGVGS